MSVQKTIVNVNFNPMRGEQIEFDIPDVHEYKLDTRNYTFIHLILGCAFLIYGLVDLLMDVANPFINLAVIGPIWTFFLEIPFFFIFLGILEMSGGVAGTFKRFGSLLFHHLREFYVKKSHSLIVTNVRLIYMIAGEGTLHSSFHDFYFDRMRSLEITLPQRQILKCFVLICSGVGAALIPILSYGELTENLMLLRYNWIIGSLLLGFGVILIIVGFVVRTRKSPYLLLIATGQPKEFYRFEIPPTTPNSERILNVARDFKFGGK